MGNPGNLRQATPVQFPYLCIYRRLPSELAEANAERKMASMQRMASPSHLRSLNSGIQQACCYTRRMNKSHREAFQLICRPRREEPW